MLIRSSSFLDILSDVSLEWAAERHTQLVAGYLVRDSDSRLCFFVFDTSQVWVGWHTPISRISCRTAEAAARKLHKCNRMRGTSQGVRVSKPASNEMWAGQLSHFLLLHSQYKCTADSQFQPETSRVPTIKHSLLVRTSLHSNIFSVKLIILSSTMLKIIVN